MYSELDDHTTKRSQSLGILGSFLQLEMFAICSQHSGVAEGSCLSSSGAVQEEPEARENEPRSQGVLQRILCKMV